MEGQQVAEYLIVDDDQRIYAAATAKSITEAVEGRFPNTSETDGLTFDVYRIASGPHRVTIKSETVRKLVIE